MNALLNEIETEVTLDAIDAMLKNVIENTTVRLVQNEGAHISFEEHGAETRTPVCFVLACPVIAF